MSNLPPHVDVSRQKVGTRLLVETTVGVWAFKLTDPEHLLVEVMSTDKRFRSGTPIIGQLVESADPKVKKRFMKGSLVKGWPFSIRFADAVLITEPLQSLLIEGEGWSYEL